MTPAGDQSAPPSRAGRSIADVAHLFVSRLPAKTDAPAVRAPVGPTTAIVTVLLRDHLVDPAGFCPRSFAGLLGPPGTVAVLSVSQGDAALHVPDPAQDLWPRPRRRAGSAAAMIEPLVRRAWRLGGLVVAPRGLERGPLDALVLWAGRVCVCVDTASDAMIVAYRLIKRTALHMPGVAVALWSGADPSSQRLRAARCLADVTERFCRRPVRVYASD